MWDALGCRRKGASRGPTLSHTHTHSRPVTAINNDFRAAPFVTYSVIRNNRRVSLPYLLYLSALLSSFPPASSPSGLLLSLITWTSNQPTAHLQFSFFFPPPSCLTPFPSCQILPISQILFPLIPLTHKHTPPLIILTYVTSTFLSPHQRLLFPPSFHLPLIYFQVRSYSSPTAPAPFSPLSTSPFLRFPVLVSCNLIHLLYPQLSFPASVFCPCVSVTPVSLSCVSVPSGRLPPRWDLPRTYDTEGCGSWVRHLWGVSTSCDPQHSHDADDGGVDGQRGLLDLLQGDAHDGQ